MMKLAFFLLSKHFFYECLHVYCHHSIFFSYSLSFFSPIDNPPIFGSKIRQISTQLMSAGPLDVLTCGGESTAGRRLDGRPLCPWCANIQPDRFAAVPGGR